MVKFFVFCGDLLVSENIRLAYNKTKMGFNRSQKMSTYAQVNTIKTHITKDFLDISYVNIIKYVIVSHTP